MKEKTKGGLVLAETTLEKQQVASQVGLVMAMGPQCYKDKERYPEGPMVQGERLGYVCTLCR
jgi:co-chaperonin GroES (HSP10)